MLQINVNVAKRIIVILWFLKILSLEDLKALVWTKSEVNEQQIFSCKIPQSSFPVELSLKLKIFNFAILFNLILVWKLRCLKYH